jgi:hypothetical protein
MKKHKLTFLPTAILVILSFVFPMTAFSSVTLTDIAGHDNQTSIQFLTDIGIIHGYPDGTYRPDNGINRAETLKLLFLAKGELPDEPSVQCFPDVPVAEWYSRFVCRGKELGYIAGYPDGNFRPADMVNKAEAIKMISQFSNWNLGEASDETLFADTDSAAWYAPYLKYAKKKNLVEYGDNNFFPDADMSRGSMAETIFRSAAVKLLQIGEYTQESGPAYIAAYNEQQKTGAQETLDSLIASFNESAAEEENITPGNFSELEHLFYAGEEGGPQLKTPDVEFNPEGTNMDIYLGLTGNTDIGNVNVLLYDTASEQWGYAYNSQTESPDPLAQEIDDFASKYTFFADRVVIPPESVEKNLETVDDSMGFLIQADTTDGKSYILGNESTTLLESPVVLQETAAQSPTIPFKEKECTYPDVDVLTALQNAFSKEGVSLTTDHLNTENFRATMKCRETSETLIRLSSDFKVLESLRKIGERIAANDFSEEEPAGKLIGAHYLLFIKVYSYCGNNCTCHCDVAWRLVKVETGQIIAAGFDGYNCGNLSSAFDAMLIKIESKTDKDIH